MFKKILLFLSCFIFVNIALADKDGIIINNKTNHAIYFGYGDNDTTRIVNPNSTAILTWDQIDKVCNRLIGCEVGLSSYGDAVYLGWFAVNPWKNTVMSPFYAVGDTDEIKTNFPTSMTIIDLH